MATTTVNLNNVQKSLPNKAGNGNKLLRVNSAENDFGYTVLEEDDNGRISHIFVDNEDLDTRPEIFKLTYRVDPDTALISNTDFHGIDLVLGTQGVNINNKVSLYPFESQAINYLSNNARNLVGGLFIAENQEGTAQKAQPIIAWVKNGAGTLSRGEGILIRTPTNSGTITNLYGIYIESQNEGSSDSYDIYAEGNSFFESIEINSINGNSIDFSKVLEAGTDAWSTATTDLNTIPKSMLYWARNNASNIPTPDEYSIIHIEITNGLDFWNQIAVNNDNGDLYTRNNENGTIGGWRKSVIEDTSGNAKITDKLGIGVSAIDKLDVFGNFRTRLTDGIKTGMRVTHNANHTFFTLFNSTDQSNAQISLRTDFGASYLGLLGNFAVGKNTADEKLDVDGNIKISGDALRMSGITTTQRNALTAQAGDIIYNKTDNKHQGYDGTTWNNLY